MKRSTARVTQLTAAKKAPSHEALGPGLHAGQLESQDGKTWRVRMLDGKVVEAKLGPCVVEALLHECYRDGRLVILADSGQGVVILGALQTTPVLCPDADGVLDLRVQRLNLEASEEMTLGTPRCRVELHKSGKAKLRSRRLVIDSPDNIKVRSALVELP